MAKHSHLTINSLQGRYKIGTVAGMDGNPQLWQLIARKMSGEASGEEVRELRGLTREDAELQSFMDVLTQFWRPAEKQPESQTELAFARHMQRLHRHMARHRP